MKTMKNLILICLLLMSFATILSAQQITYLDSYGKEVNAKEYAVKYMILTHDSLNQEQANEKTYDMQNRLIKENNYCKYSSLKKDGVQREWFINGQLKAEYVFVKGAKTGYDREWYSNGQLHRNYNCIEGRKEGELKTYWPNGQLRRFDLYKDGQFVKGECYDSLGNAVPHTEFMIMPTFSNGKDVSEYLAKQVRYPIDAQKAGQQGRVIVHFVVEKDGSLSNIVVIRNTYYLLDQEAYRVVKEMPKWIPGKMEGESVSVKYTLPVNFRLK